MSERTVGERMRTPLAAARRATAGWRARRRHESEVGAAVPVRPANLLSTPLFGDLSPSEAAILSVFMARETVAAGAVVVRQGDRDGDLYLIETGRAEVRQRDSPGAPRLLATLGPGEFFGEIAFTTGAARTADVVAIEPLTVLRISNEAYAVLSELTLAEELSRVGVARGAANSRES
ncbi:MAG TPA: cyclic nucleotide-binding domain-containing protein [Thermomicrobiales bacterium]|jgi:CRP-like cAMP-binding protein